MKFILTILIIAGLAGGVVIGLLTMGSHGNCFASYAAAATCPFLNTMAYVGMHVSFVRNFSGALIVAVLAAILILTVFISYVFSSGIFYTETRLFSCRFFEPNNTGKREQISWLSLFENSPNTA